MIAFSSPDEYRHHPDIDLDYFLATDTLKFMILENMQSFA